MLVKLDFSVCATWALDTASLGGSSDVWLSDDDNDGDFALRLRLWEWQKFLSVPAEATGVYITSFYKYNYMWPCIYKKICLEFCAATLLWQTNI